jgi:hypothetical protein
VAGSAERATEDPERWALAGTEPLTITTSTISPNNARKVTLNVGIFIMNIVLSTVRTTKNR